MILGDLFENEIDFKGYILIRLNLFERDNIESLDEIDILCFFFYNKFPLREEKSNDKIVMISFNKDID